MSWGFESGRTYNRRIDIHQRFGGQQQGGIITPKDYALVIIITGEEGLQHGYGDRQRDDGIFEYFGEGQVGDMVFERGNRAISSHSADGKSLLLFRKTSAGLTFIDEMIYDAHHLRKAPDRNGKERNAIVFELRPISAIVESVDQQPINQAPIQELRARALAAGTLGPNPTTTSTRTIYQRSVDVRDYVLARAIGHCEGCCTAAPFLRPNGSPYLEPHHIRRVSDGGPDHPAFVIALCPNCHRRVHAGADGADYNTVLLGKMASIEPDQT